MELYLIQQPRTLQSLAIPKIGDWIGIKARELLNTPNSEDLLPHQIAIIQQGMDGVPYMLHDKVANEAIRALSELNSDSKYTNFKPVVGKQLANHIIERITEVLFSNNTTSLSINSESRKFKPLYKALIAKSSNLTRLIKLDIQDVKLTFVIQLIRKLHALKIFKHAEWNNNVLCSLVMNCKLLEELDLSTGGIINKSSIQLIVQLPRLRTVKFRKIDQEYVEMLLLSCKRIEHIVIKRKKNVIGKAIKKIVKDNTGVLFRLKTYSNEDWYRGLDPLELVVQTCPLIQEMDLTRHRVPPSYLMHLEHLHDLHVLKLYYFRFYTDQVKQLLEVKGSSLVDLRLFAVSQLDMNALMIINQTCPNLESLTIGFVKQPQHYLIPNTYGNRCLDKLKILILRGIPPPGDELIYLLSSCPNVEYIFVDVLILLTDEIMLRVLANNPLNCLKKLVVFEHKLSALVLDRMVENSTLKVVYVAIIPEYYGELLMDLYVESSDPNLDPKNQFRILSILRNCRLGSPYL